MRFKKGAKFGYPQNKREDIVWNKGFNDGMEVAHTNYKKIFGRIYWSLYIK